MSAVIFMDFFRTSNFSVSVLVNTKSPLAGTLAICENVIHITKVGPDFEGTRAVIVNS